MNQYKIISIIPARGGSKGIPKKNIALLGEQPLISYSILDSLRTPIIEETFVSTDDEEIKSVAEQYGAVVPFLRPKELATDTSTDMQWAWHFLLWFEEKYKYLPELVIHLRPTTPFRDINMITLAVEKMKVYEEATSLRSVEEFGETPWKWFNMNNEYLTPTLSEDSKIANLPRQMLPKIYRPNGYVDILIPEVILKGSLHGGNILGFITPKTIEIDTKDDLDYATYLIDKKNILN